MSADQIAMWCGYAVMIAGSVVVVFFAIWLLIDSYNEFVWSASKAARESYWWARWMRFERIAKLRAVNGFSCSATEKNGFNE